MDQRRPEILVFEVDGRRYGLPAAEVRELARAVTIVPLPSPTALVEGIIDVRGEAVPVLDLRARLGLPARGVEPSDHLIIARAAGRTVALRVDRALELRGGDVDAIDAGGPAGGDGAVDGGAARRRAGPDPRPVAVPGAGRGGRGGAGMSWSNPAFAGLADLLATRTGLAFAPDRRPGAETGIGRAMARAGETDAASYRRRVAREPDLLDDLIVELTVGETYFFREPGQFEFLRRTALPEIRRMRGDGHAIRAWSAGCASGEEAYSLAMLLDREGLAGPIPVLATDISRAALDKARRASYTDWSLRGDDSAAARPYLRPEGGRHVVVEAIRRRVVFESLNLALDAYPSYATGTCGIDLILCRNVLIYLDPETVRAVARGSWRRWPTGAGWSRRRPTRRWPTSPRSRWSSPSRACSTAAPRRRPRAPPRPPSSRAGRHRRCRRPGHPRRARPRPAHRRRGSRGCPSRGARRPPSGTRPSWRRSRRPATTWRGATTTAPRSGRGASTATPRPPRSTSGPWPTSTRPAPSMRVSRRWGATRSPPS